MSLDVEDLELEQLMADLEAQTAELEIKPEPVAEPEPIVEELPDDSEIEALAELEASPIELQPTVVDTLNAEQQVDVEEVFGEPTEIEVEIDISTPMVAPLDAPSTSPEVEVEVAPSLNSSTDELEPFKAERHDREFLAEPQSEIVMSEKFAKEKFKLKFRPDVDLFQVDTKLTDATLDSCMLDQASLVALYVSRSAHADAQASRAKLKFEMLEAGLYDAWRRKLAETTEKVTEKAIENAVRTDKKWIAAKLTLIEANTYADIHKGFVSSLHDRRAMLIQRCNDRREDMKGQVRVVNNYASNDTQARNERANTASHASELARKALGRQS